MRRLMIFTPCKVMLGHSMGNEMGEACGPDSGEGTYKFLVKIPNGKKTFERTSKGREGNRVMLK
jgi:hypothetical protein